VGTEADKENIISFPIFFMLKWFGNIFRK
jgi:hypothetical protein